MTTQTIPRVLSAGTISSDSVKNPQGENLGSIKDLMIEIDSGQVAYAVLDFGSFLGIGGKFFAVPWQALRLLPDEHCFELDVSKEQLEDAHGFDPDHWPDMTDRSWQTSVHEVYGQQPYWERAENYTG
jgi:sporulation protein YlmC with PRC-barrel domain